MEISNVIEGVDVSVANYPKTSKDESRKYEIIFNEMIALQLTEEQWNNLSDFVVNSMDFINDND